MTINRRTKTILLALFAVTAGACHRGRKDQGEVVPAEADARALNTVTELVDAMREKYSQSWYKSLAFTQVNHYTIGGKEQTSEWVENLSVPAKLRIDFLPLSQKSGLLVENNRVSTIVSGKRIDTRRQYQARPFLVSDIYALPTKTSVRRLDSLGIDTTKIRVAKLDGDKVYIIGADRDDMTSTQAWFNAETLLLARFIQSEVRAGKTVTSDMRVSGYTDIAGVPIPESFITSREGVPALREEYTKVKVNAPMPAALFDVAKWSTVRISQ